MEKCFSEQDCKTKHEQMVEKIACSNNIAKIMTILIVFFWAGLGKLNCRMMSYTWKIIWNINFIWKMSIYRYIWKRT